MKRSTFPAGLRLVTSALLLAFVSAACSSSSSDGEGIRPPGRTSPIIVGAFDFSESRVLADVYAQALRAAGFDATRLPSVGTREIMEPALEQGQIDIVAEYQGTALTFLNFGEALRSTGAEEIHEALTAGFAARDIAVLDYAPARNRNEMVVTRETAERYGLSTISDLIPIADELVFGGPPECPSRPLCLPGLERVYGLTFERFEALDSGGPLTVAALDGGEIDVALLFTTNPAIGPRGFKVLKDDRDLQPAENVVPVVRDRVVESHGAELVATLNDVTRRLTTPVLRRFNAAVEIQQQEPAEVAADWLRSEGLSS